MKHEFKKTIPPGGKWSGYIRKGKNFSVTTLGEGGNVSLIMYSMLNTSERYNMPDTVKSQNAYFLTKGNVLLSDCGRVMASIVEDSVGWHDSLCGHTTRVLTDERYGYRSYQEYRNNFFRSGEENFVIELMRNGMSESDIVPCLNLFSKVIVEDDGSMHYIDGNSKIGDKITFRTEMDVFLLISNTPHPLDETKEYPSTEIVLEVTDSAPVDSSNDRSVNFNENIHRAFENTWDYLCLLGEV